MVTGTHGDEPEDPETEPGPSGLTDNEKLDKDTERFYEKDCKRIGVEPGTGSGRGMINKQAKRLVPPPEDSFYGDKKLEKMDIRLANMKAYHKVNKIFIDHVEKETFEKINL